MISWRQMDKLQDSGNVIYISILQLVERWSYRKNNRQLQDEKVFLRPFSIHFWTWDFYSFALRDQSLPAVLNYTIESPFLQSSLIFKTFFWFCLATLTTRCHLSSAAPHTTSINRALKFPRFQNQENIQSDHWPFQESQISLSIPQKSIDQTNLKLSHFSSVRVSNTTSRPYYLTIRECPLNLCSNDVTSYFTAWGTKINDFLGF